MKTDVARWTYELFIDGDWRPSEGGDELTIVDPATEDVIGHCPSATMADARRAIEAARRAFDQGPWPWMKPAERGRVLKRMANILDERHAELHDLIIAETGAIEGGGTIGSVDFLQCAGSVGLVHWYADHVHTAIDWAVASPPQGGGSHVRGDVVIREPAGVVAAITPFNFPFYLNLIKVIPALAAGCTVVLKPHQWTPLDAFEIARAAADAGVPAGVLNVITGGPDVGAELTTHPMVDLITFTGASATGREILRSAAATIKRVKLELGGKSAQVLLDDVSEEYVASIGFGDVLAHCGQGCTLQTRLLLPHHLLDAYRDGVRRAARQVVIGDPRSPDTTLGPLIRDEHRRRVDAAVQQGIDDGAELLTGGKRPDDRSVGFFYEPTVLVTERNDIAIAREEVFGPVLTVIPYSGSDDDAVRLANDSDYGLAGRVVSPSIGRAFDVGRRIRTGRVVCTTDSGTDTRSVPGGGQGPGWGQQPSSPGTGGVFGGFKQSGLGREWGAHGLEEFTELKMLTW